MIIHDGINIPMLQNAHDPNSVMEYSYILRPDVWQANTVYYEKESVVIPSVFNGFYFLAISGGVSGNTEPPFPCKTKATVTDGCVIWKTLPYRFYLRPGKDIVAANWLADNAAVNISIPVTTAGKTIAKISGIPVDVRQVKITIRFTFSNGEADDRSFIIPIAEL